MIGGWPLRDETSTSNSNLCEDRRPRPRALTTEVHFKKQGDLKQQ